MLHLIGKQIGLGICVVLTAITLTFFMVRLSGDPTAQILPQDATVEQRHALQKQLEDHDAWVKSTVLPRARAGQKQREFHVFDSGQRGE